MHYELCINKLNLRVATAVQLQVEVGFVVFLREDAAAAGQIAVGQRDGFAFRGSTTGGDGIGVGNQFQLAADDHRLQDAILRLAMMDFVAVELVAMRAEARMVMAVPAGVDIAGRLDDRLRLEAVFVQRDHRQVAFDAAGFQKELHGLFGLRVGVDRSPEKRMPLLKGYVLKFLCKFADHNKLGNHRIHGSHRMPPRRSDNLLKNLFE